MTRYTILTGGHSGIGLGVTKKLLTPDNKLGLIVRSAARKEDFLSEVAEFDRELVDSIDFFFADLSDQAQVRSAAHDIKSKWQTVDRLFNNAGIVSPGRKTSKQGNELHLEINTLAPVLLTQELKPLLINSDNAKVITTVTGGMGSRQLRTAKIFDDNYSGMGLYAQSKQAVMLLMNDMANDESWQGVKFLSVNPGANKTKMAKSPDTPLFIRMISTVFFHEPSVGAQRLYNAAFDERFANTTAAFLNNDKIINIKHGLSKEDKAKLLAAIQ